MMPSVAVLMTGSELMSGDTIDTNSAMIAECLNPFGLVISRKITLGDDLTLLCEELNRLSSKHDLIIVNGGLGPTQDDLTAQALSHITQQPLTRHQKAHQHLQQWAAETNKPLNNANLKQAYLPNGCDILPNPIGTAVGIQIKHNRALILATPGVPNELGAMLTSTALNTVLSAYTDSDKPQTIKLRLFGLGESHIQQVIDDQILVLHPEIKAYLEHVEIGFRVQMPYVELKIIPKIAAPNGNKMIQTTKAVLIEYFRDYIFGENDDTLPQILRQLLQKEQATLVTAESCTGGTIAAMLTQVSGASVVFHAGYITYSNAMKTAMLGVDVTLIEQHGAVSEPVVLAMAAGALTRSQSDYAIAVSGIAGPSGGSAEKPVGTVCIAWGRTEDLKSETLYFKAPRHTFQQYIAAAGLDLIRRTILDIESRPNYFLSTNSIRDTR